MLDCGGRRSVFAGQNGEKIAEGYLIDSGFEIVARNFRSRVGELDIVAIEKKTNQLVFCEVKAYKTRSYLNPLEAITNRKQLRLRKTAEFFLIRYPNYRSQIMRFDVVIVESRQVVSHLKNVPLSN